MADKFCKNKILKNKILIGKHKNIPRSIRKELKYFAMQIDAKCCYCGVRFNNGTQPTVDHIKPKKSGGLTEMSNLIVCCSKCNACKKGSLSLDEFIIKRPQTVRYLKRYINKFSKLIIHGIRYVDEIKWIEDFF